MRNIFYQMVHSLKCVFKDTKPLISKTLTIIIVILVLGSAFHDSFESSSLEPVRIGYLNEDEGEIGDIVLDNLMNAEDVREWMIPVEVSSFEEGQRLAGDSDVPEDERISAMIYIAKDFSEQYMNNADSVTVTIYCGKSSQVAATVIECVFDAFASTVNTNNILMEHFDTWLPEDFSVDSGVEAMPMESTKTPDAMSYYAVAMLLMFMIFGAQYGCDGVAEDYLGVIGERIRTTPIRPYQQYIGKLLGMCVASTLQGLLIVLFTGLVYDANWGSNYLMLLAIIFSMACASTAIGALVCMLTKDAARGQSVVTLIVIACTFLAGGFVKMDMGAFKYLSPNFYAQTAIFNSVYGGDMSVAYAYIGILWGFTAAASVLAVLLSRRKRA